MSATRSVRSRVSTPPSLHHVSTPSNVTWPIVDDTIIVPSVSLESGAILPSVRVHYRLEGAINSARDNVVLIVHALTGTVRATEWWRGVVEPGGAIDPTQHAVLTANLLGGCDGTTGPTVHQPDALPPITTRDQAMVLARLLDALDIDAPQLVCGGSLGGQVTLEFAASYPERTRAAVVLAAPAVQTAQGLAWNTIMRHAVALGGPVDGLKLARQVGMLSYRTPQGLERRFGRARNDDGQFLMNAWLDMHGDKLAARFDAASYVALIDAMDTHDVGRGRGGVAAALAPVGDRLVGVGVPDDLLYPATVVREWVEAAGARYVDLPSVHGHDAFLLEASRVSEVLREALQRSAPASNAAAAAPTTVEAVSRARGPLRVAIAGCGHVGGSLVALIADNASTDDVRIERVLVRDRVRPRPSLEHAIVRGHATTQTRTTDSATLLDGDIDVFVEAMGGTTLARTLIEHALRRGIRVVTANKALLAECGPALVALAAQHGTRLDFEGAVAGAVPIVRCVRSGAAGVGITAVHGILNGTSNFVLDQIAAGASLADAIRLAQERGYAEADPTRDLSGADAEDKLRVLAWLAFGVDPAALVVRRQGIDDATAAWAAQVASEGDRVKLLASVARAADSHELVAQIRLVRVRSTDPWSSVEGPNNRIVIESASAGAIVFHGAGAGGLATAGAVLADLRAVQAEGHAPR